MDWHDVMVLVDIGPSCEARLKLAAQLARKFDWKLNGVAIAPPVIPTTTPAVDLTIPQARDFGTGDLFAAEALQAAGSAADGPVAPFSNEDLFRTNTERLHTSWRELAHGDLEGIINLARRTELAILGQTDPTEGTLPWGFAPEDVVLTSGGPCLLVPYAGSCTTIGQHVMVAWDGSREAARALRDAKPLLREARKVTVVAVDLQEGAPERSTPNVDEIVMHLEVQGVAAWGRHRLGKPLPVADALLNEAADLSADLLVTGSFHHSRLRERILGGVTLELLQHMTLPILMSH